MPHPFYLTLVLITASFASSTTHSVTADEPPEEPDGLIKVAAIQISGYDKGDLPRQDYKPVDNFVPYIDRAGQDDAQLVVFPEYVLGRINVPGPETDKIAEAAKRNSIYVIIGCWEVFSDNSFANTALVFDRDGKISGKYRKTHAAIDHFDPNDLPWKKPPPEKSTAWMIENDPEWIMQPGQELPVFDFDFGRVGIMTCYDGWFPEPARILSLKGAELLVWINGRGGSVEDFIVKSILFQSHVAMIATNQAYGSGTMIADCSKRPTFILTRAADRQESYLTAMIDLDQIRKLRQRSRNFQQRRPDLYGPLTDPKQK